MAEKHTTSRGERRRKPRQEGAVMAAVTADGHSGVARLHNISESGALLGALPDIHVGELCKIELPGYGTLAGTVVRVTPRRLAVTFTPDPALRERFDDPAEICRRLREDFPDGLEEKIEATWP